MRMIAFVLGAATLSSSAVAQSWQEYAYPDYAFSVAFPASPKVEDTTYQLANGRSVHDGPVSLSKCRPMRTVANRQPDAVL